MEELELKTARARKFCEWDTPTLNELKETMVYKLRQKINDNQDLTSDEKRVLTYRVVYSRMPYPTEILCGGYAFDFSDVLKRYLANSFGRWDEYYAIDKTSLRQNVPGITEIYQIPSNE